MPGSPNDDSFRSRLAEIMASAGVPHSRISLEVLYFLPKAFLDNYAEMFSRAVKSDGGSSAQGQRTASDGALGKARGAGAKTTGRRYKKTFVVMDEKALELKTRIDKRLRLMAREIAEELAGSGSGGRQGSRKVLVCSGCKGFVQGSWSYCARCGGQLSDE